MPSRKNKRFAKKKGKASLKKTFSKKRIVGGLSEFALGSDVNISSDNNQTDANVSKSTNQQATAAPAAAAAQEAQGPPAATAAAQGPPAAPPAAAQAPPATATPGQEYSSFWSSYLPSATASTAAPPAAPHSDDSAETVNMLAYTGELERLKEMVERHPEFKDGVTNFFSRKSAIESAFDGIKEHGDNIDDPENRKRADIILYLISKGANTSSITATSASPEVMKYISLGIPKDVSKNVFNQFKQISLYINSSNVVAKQETNEKVTKEYDQELIQISNNFTDESAKELLISIAKDGTVGDLIDFIEIIGNKQKVINDFINYQQGETKLTPLMVACINNNTDIVKKMLSTENISPTINDTILKHTILLNKDSSSNTFLHHAAQKAGLIDVIADCLQKIHKEDINGIDDLKKELAGAKNSNGDTVFSIVCKIEPTQFDLIEKLDTTGLIVEKDDIHNPGFEILEKKFNEMKTRMESPDYTKNNIPKVIITDKQKYTEYLTLFKNIGYSLFNVRFADNTGFEQIYMQRWDNILKPNDKNYKYKSVKCNKYAVSSCVPTEVEYKNAFIALLDKIAIMNNFSEGKYTVTYKSVCDAIQKKYGIFDTINTNPQFKDVDKLYFAANSVNNTTVKYEEEYDEIRIPVDKYVADIFEEEFLKLVDKTNLNNKTKDYIVKSKFCKSLYMKNNCHNHNDMKKEFFKESFIELINKISEANTKYKNLNQPANYITYKSIHDDIVNRNNLNGFVIKDWSILFNNYMKIYFTDEERPKNVGYDKHPEAPSVFSGLLWGRGGKSPNTHKRKYTQKQKNTRKHK